MPGIVEQKLCLTRLRARLDTGGERQKKATHPEKNVLPQAKLTRTRVTAEGGKAITARGQPGLYWTLMLAGAG